jgi:thiosulfate reductase cytochrome b subunit
MAGATWAARPVESAHPPRHTATVRVTHWITAACFLLLLLTGVEILISHPRFYWGETGNVKMAPLFTIPIPASRGSVPTGYGFVLPDQNGWSRSLHFQSAWLLFFTALFYGVAGFVTSHFQRNLWPSRSGPYNPLQRLTYLGVIFVLVPLMFWTGLAMSPAFVSAFPVTVTIFGGQQSARTIHFFTTVLLVLFFAGHVVMVYRAGFVSRTRAMLTGGSEAEERS